MGSELPSDSETESSRESAGGTLPVPEEVLEREALADRQKDSPSASAVREESPTPWSKPRRNPTWTPSVGMLLDLPREERRRPDPKDFRPYVLLSDTAENSQISTLAYCSTKATEAQHGAPHVVIPEGTSTFPMTGLDRRTYVYTINLTVIESEHLEDLKEVRGRLVDELPALRSSLTKSLGIGQGSGGLRGVIVRFSSEMAQQVGSPIGVIVTDAQYSLERRHQIVIPGVNADEFDSMPGVRVKNAVDRKIAPWDTTIFMPVLAQSVFTADDIVGIACPSRLSDGNLATLDELFRARFPEIPHKD